MTEYYTPTRADLKPDAPLRLFIEKQLDAYAASYVDDGRVTSYDDWIDRALEDAPLSSGAHLTCGTNTLDFPYPAIKRIASQIAKEYR